MSSHDTVYDNYYCLEVFMVNKITTMKPVKTLENEDTWVIHTLSYGSTYGTIVI